MFTKQEFSQFRKRVQESLKAVAEEFDFKIELGDISYTDINFRLPLIVKKRTVNGMSYEEAEFRELCGLFGLEPTDFNKEIIINEEKYRIAGINAKSKKFPIILEKGNKTYKVSAELIRLKKINL
jgi:hypothetical protein